MSVGVFNAASTPNIAIGNASATNESVVATRLGRSTFQ
jgi:hypothetical protein